jgi:dihydroorotase
VELIRRARDEGLRVTAEVSPHHLFLTDEATSGFDTSTRVAPPLRSEADTEVLRRALAEGVIDVIATDHAPHAVYEKEVEFTLAPPGMIGLETAVAVTLELVHREILTPLELIRRLSTSAARILRLEGGSLAESALADVTLIDPERVWTYEPSEGFSRSRNSPWAGRSFRGRVTATIVGGRLVYHHEKGALIR